MDKPKYWIELILLFLYVIIPISIWNYNSEFNRSFLSGYIIIFFMYVGPVVLASLLIRFLILRNKPNGKHTLIKTFIAIGGTLGGLVFLYGLILGELIFPIDNSYSGGQAGIELLIYPFIVGLYQFAGIILGWIIGIIYKYVFHLKVTYTHKVLFILMPFFFIGIVLMVLDKSRRLRKSVEEGNPRIVIESDLIMKRNYSSKIITKNFFNSTDSLREQYDLKWEPNKVNGNYDSENPWDLYLIDRETNESRLIDFEMTWNTCDLLSWRKTTLIFCKNNNKFLLYDLEGEVFAESKTIEEFIGGFQKSLLITDLYGNEYIAVLTQRNYRENYQNLIIVLNRNLEIIYMEIVAQKIKPQNFKKGKINSTDVEILVVELPPNDTTFSFCYFFNFDPSSYY